MHEYVKGLVSVIVPVYNRANLVEKTINSILGQTYNDIEIIVVNDGSTDNSYEILRSYMRKYPGIVVVINQKNFGQVIARNNGIKIAKGEYIAFLDSDDTWEKQKIELQIPLFKGSVGLVYSGINEIDSYGKIIRTVYYEEDLNGYIYDKLLIGNWITGGTVVVKRKVLQDVGLFDESFIAAENWDLWIRISKHYMVDYVNQPLVNYLKHTGNMSLDSKRMMDASWKILQKHLSNSNLCERTDITHSNAYANYYYKLGVLHFSNGDYWEARKYFRECWQYVPKYQDSRVRYFRTYIGRKGNYILASIRKKIFKSW